jgi:hypothetical protein
MSLQDEIDKKKKEIHTDGYPMSIGEIIGLYEKNELDIHPEFQRFFRWTQLQKTKLIESILLGIPVPSIFVSQREDGVWDVIDGLQRLSTIFEFVGVLRDEENNVLPASKLQKTDYLPSLENKSWESEDKENSFSPAQRITFKREKLDIKVIKKESDKATKYELFQRLNTLGTSLSAQEVRNCLLIMINRAFYKWLSDLSELDAFRACLSLSDRQLEQRYDMELALRFLAFRHATQEELRQMQDVGEYLTEAMKRMAEDPNFNFVTEQDAFARTFQLLEAAAGDNTFKRYDYRSDRFLGGFLVSAFEGIAVGLGRNIDNWTSPTIPEDQRNERLLSRIKTLWKDNSFQKNSGAGVRGTTRAAALIPLGNNLFKA